MEDLNLRPLRCQRSALTPELIARLPSLERTWFLREVIYRYRA